MYWFGIQAIWGGYEAFGQKQVQLLVGESVKGTAIGILDEASRTARRSSYAITGGRPLYRSMKASVLRPTTTRSPMASCHSIASS